MLTINTNWKAAFSQPGVAPIVHVRILDLETFTLSGTWSSSSKTITVSTTALLEVGMTVSGDGIPAGSYITAIDHPASYGPGVSTTFQIPEAPPVPGLSPILTFGKVYEMTTQGVNRRYHSTTIVADPVVLSVVPISVTMSELDREPQVGELNIDVADEGTLRRLMGTLNLTMKRKQVEVRVGAAHLDYSDFEKVFVGELFDIIPANGIITLKVRDSWQGLADVAAHSGWINAHPLQAVKNAIIDSGALFESQIDADSFDPDHSTKADIGHYCVSSYQAYWRNGFRFSPELVPFTGDRPAREGAPNTNTFGVYSVPLKPIVRELARGMYGFLFAGADGKLKFKHYNENDSAVRHFTTSDYSDFRQEMSGTGVINDVQMKIGYGNKQQEFRLQNTLSVQSYGLYEKNLGDLPYSATSTYVYLTSSDTALTTTDTSVVVFAGQTSGLSGTRGFASGGSVGANAAVQVARPLMLLNQKELIKCTSVTGANTGAVPHREIWRTVYDNPYDIGTTQEAAPDIAKVAGMSRAFGSTIPRSIELDDGESVSARSWEHARDDEEIPQWWREPLWDITMLYDYAMKILKRYQDGLPTIRFTAPLSHFDLELGDFITIDASEFLFKNINGLDSGTKWEIIGKDASFFGGEVGISFLCALVNETPITLSTLMPLIPPMKIMDPFLTFGDSQISNTVTGNSVQSGMIASISAASDRIDVTPGCCSSGGVTFKFNPFTSPPLPANRDCYVGVSASGLPVVFTTANGDHPPAIGPNEVRLCKAVTGGSSVISSITDVRALGGATPKNFDFDSNIHNRLLPNDGFSAWTLGPTHSPDGWHLATARTFQECWSQSTDSRTGNLALVSRGGVAVASHLTSNLVPLEPGMPYIVSVWIKGSSTDTFNVIYDLFSDRSGSVASTYNLGKGNYVPVGSSSYIKHSFEFLTDSTTKYARIKLSRPAVGGGLNADDILIDSVGLAQSPPRFSAMATVDQTVGAGATVTVQFPTQNIDNADVYDNTTHKFRVLWPGLYSFTVAVPYSASVTMLGSVSLYKTPAGGGGGGAIKTTTVSSLALSMGVGHIHVASIFLDEGDVLTVSASSAVGAWDIKGSSTMQCVFEGRKID